VSVSGFGGLASSVTLIAGVAPVDAPRGATFTQQCDATRSGSCAITVVGLAGEYDPFAGKPGAGLSVVKVGTGAALSCPVATVAISSATQVVASWPGARPPGGICVVPLTVKDAQGRTGPGQLTLDVLSFPQTPLSVTTTAFTGTSVTLSVPLGEAAQAHPTITGVQILEGGSPVPGASCSPGGPAAFSCVVNGLVNGERHQFTARAVNSVGQSLDTTAVESWAYRAPVVTSLTATSVYDPSRTTQSAGVVNVAIGAADDTVQFRVNGQQQPRSGDNTELSLVLAPGAQSIEVVPVSQFQPPIGAKTSDGAARSVQVTAIGSPSYSNNGSATSTTTTVALNGATLNLNSGTARAEKFVAWELNTGAPSCVANGASVSVNGSPYVSDSSTITVPTDKVYSIKACGTNGYGLAESQPQTVETFTPATPPPGDLTYTVGVAPEAKPGNVRAYQTVTGPTIPPRPLFGNVFTRGGRESSDLQLNDNDIAGIDFKYCRTRFFGERSCSDAKQVKATGAPTTVTVAFPSATSCRSQEDAGKTNLGWISQGARNDRYATITAVVAENKQSVVYTVTFKNEFASLNPAVSDSVCLVPPPVVEVPPGEGG